MAVTAMTDVPLPVSVAGAIWTSLLTAGAALTLEVQNRHPYVDIWVRVNGSSGGVADAADAAAMRLRPYERLKLILTNGDKAFARPDANDAGRATICVNS